MLNKRRRCGGCRVHLCRHALLDDALHPEQADADLVLDKLAHGAHATVAEMVDVIWIDDPVVDLHHTPQQGDDVVRE